ncbi:MAG: hypothetical protein IPP71_03600 [Bacteroidetes bacterium]|nr:hypothetical protein [Bacteroidota bacterium]
MQDVKEDDPAAPSGSKYLWVKAFGPSNGGYDYTYTAPVILNGTDISFVLESTTGFYFEKSFNESSPADIGDGNYIMKYRVTDGAGAASFYENMFFSYFQYGHQDNQNVWGLNFNSGSGPYPEFFKTDYNGNEFGVIQLAPFYFSRINWVNPVSSHEFINLALNGEAEKMNFDGQSVLTNSNALSIMDAPNSYTLAKWIDVVKLNNAYYGQMSVIDSGSLAEVSYLFKMDNNLNHVWHQPAPVNCILTDGASLVTIGNNNGSFTGGEVNKFSPNGTLLWSVPIGGSCRLDSTSDINTNGNIYVYITPKVPYGYISIGSITITGLSDVIVKFNTLGQYQGHISLPFDCKAKIKSFGIYLAFVGRHRSTADFGIRQLQGQGNFVALMEGF